MTPYIMSTAEQRTLGRALFASVTFVDEDPVLAAFLAWLKSPEYEERLAAIASAPLGPYDGPTGA